MSIIKQVQGSAVPVMGNDIDTDRIIPAQFLKCITFDDLAEGMFYHVKVDPYTEEKTNHPLNSLKYQNATVMLSGANFGCGSSREHAPQSIYRNGFRAIIAESFAEIFFGNATTLGMPCVCASSEDIDRLVNFIKLQPDVEILIDLERLEVRYDKVFFSISIPESARTAFLNGIYDPLTELLQGDEAIQKIARQLPYV